MPKTSHLFAAGFMLAHLILIAPFVPLDNVLPASLGAVSMSSMALTLVLAARWRVVDRIMGGPDKSYAAHRWLGIFALGGALGHWALASSLGDGVVPIFSESGEDAGGVAATGLIIMSAAAMVRVIPYHLWKASHMLMGPVFLIAAFHTFFVASPLAIGAAPWVLMAVASVLGLAALGQTLLRKAAPTRLVTVQSATPFDGGVDVTLRADRSLPGFRPGQFSTLALNRAPAEAHPFTIAGGDATSRRLVIRAAGDWTDKLVASVQAGDQFRLGAGVGRFLPQIDSARRDQLWVAGGVGITPFLAALERMTPDDGAPITLVYCIRSRGSAGGLADVERHTARLPQVTLVLLNEADGQRLTPARLSELVQDLPTRTQVYLCGPEGLKNLVTTVWREAGKRGRIHSERFDFRGAYALTDLIYIGKPLLDAAQTWAARRKDTRDAAAGA